jgi:hypothetical protein
MEEKKRNEDFLAETLVRELGSAESRAAARRIIDQTPIVITEYISRDGPRDEEGCPTGPIKEFKTAQIGDKFLTREEGESAEEFERRAIAETPATKWGFIRMAP